jgi:hypothetical protein
MMVKFEVWSVYFIETSEGCFCDECMSGCLCRVWEYKRVKGWLPATDADILRFYEVQEAFAMGNMPKAPRPRMKPPEARFGEWDYFARAARFIKRQERRMERRSAVHAISEQLAELL